jgi:hypothetical protein
MSEGWRRPNDTLPATMDDDGLEYRQMRAFPLALATFLDAKFRMVIERLNDMGPYGSQGNDRGLANRLVSEFEERAAKTLRKSR